MNCALKPTFHYLLGNKNIFNVFVNKNIFYLIFEGSEQEVREIA